MSKSGGAAGFVEVGDVLIETVVTVMTEDETGESQVGFLEQAGVCPRQSLTHSCVRWCQGASTVVV